MQMVLIMPLNDDIIKVYTLHFESVGSLGDITIL